MTDSIDNQIIEGAIEILQEPDSWIQGQISDGDGRYCIIGALSQVAKRLQAHESENWDCWISALNRIRLLPELQAFGGNYRSGCIAQFNDDPNTTHEDVLLVLKKALHG